MAEAPQYSSTAGGRLFQVAELVELIFLHLPAEDLLVSAQGISKTCKGVIDKSVKLQQALFFEPLTCRPSFTSDRPRLANPFFARVALAAAKEDEDNASDYESDGEDTNDAQIKHGAENAYVEPSWRRMLLCQPPLPFLKLMRRDRMRMTAKWQDWYWYTSAETPGVRMGDVDEDGEYYALEIKGCLSYARLEGEDHKKWVSPGTAIETLRYLGAGM